MSNKLKLDTKEVDRIMKKLDVNVDAVIRRAAFQIEGEAKKKAPYETTALRNSIYVETKAGAFSGGHQSSYSTVAGNAAQHAASAGNAAKTEKIPAPTKLGHAHVGPCMDYAAYVEYPGHVRKGGERPYLTPPAEEVAHRYNSGKEWESIIK